MTDKSAGNKGISAFILEKGMEGFTFGSKERKMGIRGSATYELVFNNVKVPKENLLGEEGKGFKVAMSTLDGGRIGIAAQALGIAQGAIDETLNYVLQEPRTVWASDRFLPEYAVYDGCNADKGGCRQECLFTVQHV